MLRSLFSGASGLRAHQVRMDVIGNNIANVNTTGFKSSRANFQDLLSQTLRSPLGATTTAGSINPAQVGIGVMVAGINTKMDQGGLQMTGRTLDLAIQGNGFFIIKKNSGDPDENAFYTREGIFYTSFDGSSYYLVNSNGYFVCDSSGQPINLGSDPIETINISDTGDIIINGTAITQRIALATFPNTGGLERVGQNLFRETPASGEHSYDNPGDTGTRVTNSRINSGYLEMSNVDLSEEFTNMITTQRGFQANARVITVSDTLLQELVDLKR
ncbi:MAG: flagellar hook-basal body complex protein [Firmicutes bacterium]|nr:flagellar hook-basal body complex protein [Bacillota bacterium]